MTTPQPSPPRPPRRKPKTWKAWAVVSYPRKRWLYGAFLNRLEARDYDASVWPNENTTIIRVTIRLAPTRRRKAVK